MIIINENNAPEVIITELALAIRSAREQLRSRLPYLDADDLVRKAIHMGMMSDEDLEKVLGDQRKEILGQDRGRIPDDR